jgi:arylsulfatase A-like enzyme
MKDAKWLAGALLLWVAVVACAAPGAPGAPPAAGAARAAPARPNVVWIVAEDMSPDFSAYRDAGIRTPNLDRLATEGVKFTRAFTTGPICSISRSALITGMYQTAIGAHHHRSGRGELKIHLPGDVVPVPRLLRDAGYHASNVTVQEFTRPEAELRADPSVGVAKTDYNFEWDAGVYDRTHWAAREPGRPFFAQVQLNGGKYRHGARWDEQVEQALGSRTPPEAVRLPPYLPDDPVIRADWAQYLDTVRYTDREIGRVIERLREAGELEHTYVFFLTDHGISHVRNKQFLYDGGTHVPLVVRGPGLGSGSVRTDLVEHIDVAATSLALAGVPVPAWMHGRDLFARGFRPRRYVFAARDRADETVDRIRSVRSERYKYIRNGYPARPYLQPNRYKDDKPIVRAMRRLHAEGMLTPAQALIMAEARPAEELYDMGADPHELHNLAADPARQAVLAEMRRAADEWAARTADRGRDPEPEAMYGSDMAAYLSEVRNSAEAVRAMRGNIELMKAWAAEGR